MHDIQRRPLRRLPGLLVLILLVGVTLVTPPLAILTVSWAARIHPIASVTLGALWSVVGILIAVGYGGFRILEPNQAAVGLLFGRYVGTLDTDGWSWINPLVKTTKVSLRLTTFETPHLKVNEAGGRPIEIGAVVTWAVAEPEVALLACDNFATFLRNRTEVALRKVAASHPYEADEGQDCLRGNTASVGAELASHLTEEAKSAGVVVRDVTITHLAYAPEIAGIMLVRQQAESLLSARRVIVEGAVRIASDAIRQLEAEGHAISDADKGRTLSNLLTVLASDRGTAPVVQVGS